MKPLVEILQGTIVLIDRLDLLQEALSHPIEVLLQAGVLFQDQGAHRAGAVQAVQAVQDLVTLEVVPEAEGNRDRI